MVGESAGMCACVSLENYLDTMIELEARCIALGGTGTDCAVSY